jgi:hypothetical protein
LRTGRESGYAAAISNLEVAMRQGEYERHRRALEAQFQADVELLRAGYQAKLRALEMIWLTAADEALPAAPPPLPALEPLQLQAAAPDSETPPEAPAAPAPQPALRPGQVRYDVEDIFAELPEEFEKQDVVRLLGYAPPRSTLNRALSELLQAKRTKIVRYSDGYTRTRYRKLPPDPSSG